MALEITDGNIAEILTGNKITMVDFIDNLSKLSKDELIIYINDYYINLVTRAEIQMNDKINYRMDEYGRVKMTEANLLKNLLMLKVKDK